MGDPLGNNLSGAGSGFPGGAVTFNLRANGAGKILEGTATFGDSGAIPTLDQIYQAALTVATTSFESGSNVEISVCMNSVEMDLDSGPGKSFIGTWDGSANFISIGAIEGTWSVDDLNIVAGLSSNCAQPLEKRQLHTRLGLSSDRNPPSLQSYQKHRCVSSISSEPSQGEFLATWCASAKTGPRP